MQSPFRNPIITKEETEDDDGKAHWHETFTFNSTECVGAINNDWQFTIICNTKHFITTVSTPLDPADPTYHPLIKFNNAFAKDDDNDNDTNFEEAQDEILDLMLEVGWRKLRAVAPAISKTKLLFLESKKSLYEALNLDLHLDRKDDTLDLPRYFSRDVIVENKMMSSSSGYIAKVSVNGFTMCSKISTAQSFKAVQREYDSLLRISSHTTSFPAPKILGLVIDNKNNTNILGILEQFIDNKGTLSTVIK